MIRRPLDSASDSHSSPLALFGDERDAPNAPFVHRLFINAGWPRSIEIVGPIMLTSASIHRWLGSRSEIERWNQPTDSPEQHLDRIERHLKALFRPTSPQQL
ncbi:MAG: hypothetical protein C4334_01725 [Pyrinomonas sp.]